MANVYTLTVSAVDNVTVVIDNINKRLAQAQKQWAQIKSPFTNLANSFAKFSQLSGLSAVGQKLQGLYGSLKNIGNAAFGVFKSFAQILEPLGILTGAATLAGFGRLAAVWGQAGTALRNQAAALGMTTDRVYNLNKASELAGVKTNAFADSLKSMQNTIRGVQTGQDQKAMMLFNLMHIDPNQEVEQVQAQVFEALKNSKVDIATKRLWAHVLNIDDENMFAGILKYGSKYFSHYKDMARQYSQRTAASIEAADQFREAQTKLGLALEDVGNRIMETAGPALTKLTTDFADWIAKSPEGQQMIAALGDAIKRLAQWLDGLDWTNIRKQIKTTIDQFIDWGKKIGQWVSDTWGWKDALLALAGAFAAIQVAGLLVTLGKVAGILATIATNAGLVTTAFGLGILGLLAKGGVDAAEDLTKKLYDQEHGIKPGEKSQWDLTHESMADNPLARWLDEKLGWLGLNFAPKDPGAVDRQMRQRFVPGQNGQPPAAVPRELPFNQEQFDAFAHGVGDMERSRYDQMGGSSGRYAGRYQMGPAEIAETAQALGEHAPSQQEFLHDPAMQERFFAAYTRGHYQTLMKDPAFAAMSNADKAKILAYAHNQGAGGALQYLHSGVIGRDANGTDPREYGNRVMQYWPGNALQAPIPVPAPAPPATSATPVQPSPGNTTLNGAVRIDINHTNPPPGTTVRARSFGPFIAPPSYQTSMPYGTYS